MIFLISLMEVTQMIFVLLLKLISVDVVIFFQAIATNRM